MAMKVPPDSYAQTVSFYRDVIGLEPLADSAGEVGFEFGDMRLWIDKAPAMKQTELWLELRCESPEAAANYLAAAGVARCDEVEALPEGFGGFWVRNPAGVVHLVCTED